MEAPHQKQSLFTEINTFLALKPQQANNVITSHFLSIYESVESMARLYPGLDKGQRELLSTTYDNLQSNADLADLQKEKATEFTLTGEGKEKALNRLKDRVREVKALLDLLE
ncbi:hypothetical protein [Spirosoma validum]|uniref:Uncharacterized protein n=1 Tax=Spirosoma validum TaxID=2771355 RepID=A0A927GEU2_9BACT|nr:hypothetical protein [Spirosoma validum]MBD2755154.1 hypothetical protein [Spirosoma validum]